MASREKATTVEISRVKKGYPTHTCTHPTHTHSLHEYKLHRQIKCSDTVLCASHVPQHTCTITLHNTIEYHILRITHTNTMLNTCTILEPYTCTLHPFTIGCSPSITENAVCSLELRAGPAEVWLRLMELHDL